MSPPTPTPRDGMRRRPSLPINDALIERIATGVSVGMRYDEAAEAAGLHKATLRKWRARGRSEPGTLYARLNERLVEAEANFEKAHLERIVAAATQPATTTIVTEKLDKDGNPVKETRTTVAPPQWTPSAWLLERTRPERYALIKRVETGPPGAFDHLNEDELNATILRLVPKGRGRKGGGEGGSAPASEAEAG